jgi:ParB/RepB/Spo0J family partition protein
MAIADSAPNTRIDSGIIHMIPLDQIRPWRNPRQTFDEAALQELADSIKQLGVLEPVLVRLGEALGTYDLLAGERRWRASKLAGLDVVPCRVLDADDERATQIALVENLARVDLNPMEEAEGYRQLVELGWKQAKIAEAVNRSQPSVANTMRLLKLPEDVQQLIRDRQLSASHGVALARFEAFPELARGAAALCVKDHLSAHQAENILELYYQFRETGLIREFSRWGTPEFDRAVCNTCPYDAHRNVKGGTGWEVELCLRPAHYDELVAAAKAKEEGRRANIVAQALEDGDKKLPRVDSLPWDSYEQLVSYNTPPGCTAACECRGRALDRQGNTVNICTKPRHLQGLRAAESKRVNAWRTERRNEAVDLAATRVANASMGSREWAVILSALARTGDYNGYLSSYLKSAAKRYGYELEVSQSGATAEQLEALAGQTTEFTLSRICVEAILHWEIKLHYDPQNWRRADTATWYLGVDLPREEPGHEEAMLATIDAMAAGVDIPEDDEASRALTRRLDAIEGRACFLCDCLDVAQPGGVEVPMCTAACCEPECWDKGVALVTQRGGVCATCAEQEEICRVCGCTNDNGCEDDELGTCDWAEHGLCTVCAEKAIEVAS